MQSVWTPHAHCYNPICSGSPPAYTYREGGSHSLDMNRCDVTRLVPPQPGLAQRTGIETTCSAWPLGTWWKRSSSTWARKRTTEYRRSPLPPRPAVTERTPNQHHDQNDIQTNLPHLRRLSLPPAWEWQFDSSDYLALR